MRFYLYKPLSWKKFNPAEFLGSWNHWLMLYWAIIPRALSPTTISDSCLKDCIFFTETLLHSGIPLSFRFSTVTRKDDLHPLNFLHLNSASATQWLVTFKKDNERNHTAKRHTLMKCTKIINLGLWLAKDLRVNGGTRLSSEFFKSLRTWSFPKVFTEWYVGEFSHFSVKGNDCGSQCMFRKNT